MRCAGQVQWVVAVVTVIIAPFWYVKFIKFSVEMAIFKTIEHTKANEFDGA